MTFSPLNVIVIETRKVGTFMENKIAFCGLVCSECSVFIAAGTGDEELKEKDPEHCALCGEYPCIHIDSYVP